MPTRRPIAWSAIRLARISFIFLLFVSRSALTAMLPSKSLLTSLLLLAGICVAPLPAFARPVAVREPSLARRDTSDGALARRLYAPSRRNASPLIYARKVASHSNDDDADDDADDTADDDGPGFADDLAKGGRKAADLTESSVNTAVGMTEGTIRGVARVTTNAGKSVFNSAWGMTKDAAGAIGDGIGGMFSHSGASTVSTHIYASQILRLTMDAAGDDGEVKACRSACAYTARRCTRRESG